MSETILWSVIYIIIYLYRTIVAQQYLKALNSTIHLVLDGWTAPIVASFLGLVVVWFHEGVIYRAVLEFIRLVLIFVMIYGFAASMHYPSQIDSNMMENILLRLLPAVYGDLGLTNLFVTNISLISCNLSLL